MPLSSHFFNKVRETYDGKFIEMDVNGERHIKIWSRRFPEGKIFKVWLLASYKFLLKDDEGQSWVYYPLPKDHKLRRKHFWTLSCQILCKVKRPHLTCLWCPYRRILAGKHANPVRCKIMLDFMETEIPFSFLRRWIIKNLTSLKEAIAHW